MEPLVQIFVINSSLLFFVEEFGNAESKKVKTCKSEMITVNITFPCSLIFTFVYIFFEENGDQFIHSFLQSFTPYSTSCRKHFSLSLKFLQKRY